MIKKSQAQEIIKRDRQKDARNSSSKMNQWISDIMNEVVSTPMEAGSSMEGPPSMDTPPWKGTHGDA